MKKLMCSLILLVACTCSANERTCKTYSRSFAGLSKLDICATVQESGDTATFNDVRIFRGNGRMHVTPTLNEIEHLSACEAFGYSDRVAGSVKSEERVYVQRYSNRSLGYDPRHLLDVTELKCKI